MSDDLVKRLRDWEHVWPDDMNKPAGHLYEDAADRIEELEAKLAEYKHVASAINTQWAESQDEIADLKASLAKAVHRFAAKAVRSMTQVDEAFENWNKKQDEEAFIKLGAALVSNHETLAELTGGKDE